MVVIVGVTAALVAEPPAKAQAVERPVSRDGRIGPYDFTVTVDPARAGRTRSICTCSTPLASSRRSTRSSCPPRCLQSTSGPLELKATPAGPGHVLATPQLPLAGDWQLQLAVRKGEFDQWSAAIDLPIRKD